MTDLTGLAARVFNRPWMIWPEALRALEAKALQTVDIDVAALKPVAQDARPARRLNTQAGIAVIDVSGSLLNRPDFWDRLFGFGGYEDIAAEFDQAEADNGVRAILLRLDSPGGEVAGVFDLADKLRGGSKPLWSVTDDTAFSAGYLLGSQADHFLVSQTGGVGSVGVRTRHVDQSAFNERLGFKVTEISSGEKKIQFSPHMPLSEQALADLQASVDEGAEMFVDAVARARPGLTTDAIKATEAGTFFGKNAVEVGFADGVANFETALAQMQGSVAGGVEGAAAVFDLKALRDVSAKGSPEKQVSASAEVEKSEEVQEQMPEQEKKTEAAESPPVDLVAVRKEEREKAQAEYREISGLCKLAGPTILKAAGLKDADDAISRGLSAEEVRAKVFEANVAEDQKEETQVDPLHTGFASGDTDRNNVLTRACHKIADEMKHEGRAN